MALGPFASSYEVEAVWGELTLDEERKVDAWLAVASNNLRLIGRKRGVNVDQYIAGDEVLEEAASNTVVASIRRVLLNPKGVRQRSTTTSATPYSEMNSETVDSALSASEFYFTENDLIWLPVIRKKKQPRSFSVRSGFRA